MGPPFYSKSQKNSLLSFFGSKKVSGTKSGYWFLTPFPARLGRLHGHRHHDRRRRIGALHQIDVLDAFCAFGMNDQVANLLTT
jgi:hypothetical protein